MGNGPRDPRIGTLLRDRWRIEARLGRGGVATVYAAVHRNGNRVAIKMLNGEFSRHPEVKKRFLREGYAANAVNHPGVVRVLDDDVAEDGTAFLVMDLLEGEMLDERRVRLGGRLPVSEVLPIADQLLDVLAAAHDKAILHRDIKPENIFIEHDGTVKVLDFGVARMRDAAHENTATGMLLGTPEFMSPEQANGIQGHVDAKTDLWAAGATLFTLLSGEPVHDCNTTAAQILATVTRPARSLASVTKDVPRQIITVIDRALAFEKQKRWPDARAMKSALEAAARLAGITGVTPAPKPAPAAAAPRPQAKAAVQTVPPRAAPRHVAIEVHNAITGDEATIVTTDPLTPEEEPVASSGPTRQRPRPGMVSTFDGNTTVPLAKAPVAVVETVISDSHLIAEDEDVLTRVAPPRVSPVGGFLVEAPTVRVHANHPSYTPHQGRAMAPPPPAFPSARARAPKKTGIVLAIVGVIFLWALVAFTVRILLLRPNAPPPPRGSAVEAPASSP